MSSNNRQTWDEYFFDIADKVATRSVCTRRQVGAVAVDQNNRIIGTGYNGPPSGFKHCTSQTCYRTVNNIPSGEQSDKCFAIHAEANIVLQLGFGLKGGTVYVTNQPCVNCFKLLIGAGVNRILWKHPYPDSFSQEMMNQLGVIFFGGEKNPTRWERKEYHDGIQCL